MANNSNPFSLLDSDDEGTPTQRQQPKVATKKTVTKPKSSNNKAPANNARRTGGNNQGTDYNAPGKEQRRPRGRGNNQRGGDNQRRNKRAFDRRSGTGYGKEIKKDGAGSRNWGKPGDEVADVATAENDEETPVEAEEEDQTPELSLEDFEAMRLEKRQGEAFAELEVRKGSAPVDGQAYAKKEAEEESFLQMGSKKEKRTRDRKQEKSRILDVNFKVQAAQPAFERDNFRGNNRGRNNKRSNRGRGGRGGRGQGGNRGPRGAPVDANDTAAFPTLGN